MAEKTGLTIALLFAEARRRHVFRSVAVYAGIAFGILQVADIFWGRLGFADDSLTTLLIVVAAGFPAVILGAWFLEFSAAGVHVTPRYSAKDQSAQRPVRVVEIVILFIALGVGWLYAVYFFDEDHQPPAEVSEPVPRQELQRKAAPDETVVAVLPFANLSSSDDNAFFAAGVHEDLLSILSHLEGMKVISRTSVVAIVRAQLGAREIGEQLGATHIVEGSVRRSGGQVRVSVQLIDALSETHLWSASYDRELVDIFDLQSRLAQEVAAELKISMAVDTAQRLNMVPTTSVKAYDLYLRARDLLHQSNTVNLSKGRQKLQEAIALDNDFAEAYAALSQTYSDIGFFVVPHADTALARRHANRAIEIAPSLAAGYHARANALSQEKRNNEAYADYERALTLDRSNGPVMFDYGLSAMQGGDFKKAMALWIQNLDVDPLSASTNTQMAFILGTQGRTNEQQAYIDRAIQLDPANSDIRLQLFYSQANAGEMIPAIQLLYAGLQNDPESVQIISHLAFALSHLGANAAVLRWADYVKRIHPPAAYEIQSIEFESRQVGKEFLARSQQWTIEYPDDLALRNRLANAYGFAAREALEREDTSSFFELMEVANAMRDEMLRKVIRDGRMEIRTDNYFWVLSHVYGLAGSGYKERARKLADEMIAYSLTQPDWNITFGHFALGLLHAIKGEDDKALTEFLSIEKDSPGFYHTWFFDGFAIPSGIWGTSKSLGQNIALTDMRRRLDARNAEILNTLETVAPEILQGRVSSIHDAN
jgi:adenylate cyclase